MDAIAAWSALDSESVERTVSSPSDTHKKSVALANPMAASSSTTAFGVIFFIFPSCTASFFPGGSTVGTYIVTQVFQKIFPLFSHLMKIKGHFSLKKRPSFSKFYFNFFSDFHCILGNFAIIRKNFNTGSFRFPQSLPKRFIRRIVGM